MKRLSAVSFKTADGTTVLVDWRKHTVTVLVFLHDEHCLACRQIAQRYEYHRANFAAWDAALWLIWRGDRIPEGSNGVREESSRIRTACLKGDAAGVVLVDRHGVEVRQWGASVGKGFPPPEEVLAAVKLLATQCPE